MYTFNLSTYLKFRKAAFLADNVEGWTVVMGNGAGDLDSLASALGYAWLRCNTRGKAIAYITTPREDFVLRAENLHALGLAGIDHPFEELYCSGDLEPAGSCSSLGIKLNQSSSNLFIPPEMSTLLLSAILIDTQGLKEGGKALDVDKEAVAVLIPNSLLAHKEKISLYNQTIIHLPSVQSLSATLGEKKLSVSHLSTRDLLRRDYKEYAFSMPASDNATQSFNMMRVGLTTVPRRLSVFFISSSYPIKEIQDWLDERDLSVLGILTTFRSTRGKGRREQLWIVNADEGIAEKLLQGLESNEELKLKGLISQKVMADEARFGDSFVARAYKQDNARATRKQTAPILRRLMEGL
ncbi:uncharacterized protein F5147DRAFT_718208 [Suillus discolor]|uniref:DHHA2 domain-containing protein n=1 Tax=Suillus discolor TaxID=1912936 RepID=A0A9P7EX88_9AGAM|nr:uncharacterized protein F5147DRAFT_718208 [Suillus discolor]KAG2095427.1 hypothetical protein F5147DRAFT_718208 [Suillus discolor]